MLYRCAREGCEPQQDIGVVQQQQLECTPNVDVVVKSKGCGGFVNDIRESLQHSDAGGASGKLAR